MRPRSLRAPADRWPTRIVLKEIGMTRLTVALAVWMSFASAAWASLAPRKESRALTRDIASVLVARLAAPAAEQPSAQATTQEFVLKENAEVLLNGKPCKYEQIPSNATIVLLELAADNKTVLKIHFRTPK
jgi:hypothetical protein